MAKREVVESDLSGKPDAATVTFGLAGTWYEIDLTDEEKKKLEQVLKTYLTKGRQASEKHEKKRVVPETTPEEREEIRAWARQKGYEFAERGRIPKNVLAAYDKAHKINRSN
ncbi:histone-like nucleoid-structuring protein Lsr2 [Saccharopolyspora shandongensis]|uniref:histone-like nucleoid-structuring protein Lsr2 n=1 Tax=Saccharopolyspora shandongensis TaxID=418495 RepID=UPI0033C3B18A